MTDAEKCCIWLDYSGYEAHHLDGQVWVTMLNRELSETLELEISADEVRNCAKDYDHEYLLHKSFRTRVQNNIWLDES